MSATNQKPNEKAHDSMLLKNIIKILKGYAKRNYGNKCKDFEYLCPVCQPYLAIQLLKNMSFLNEGDGVHYVGKKR